MRSLLLRNILALLFSFTFLFSVSAADFSKLVILHSNDTHGNNLRTEKSVGMAAVAAHKKALEREGYEVLLLDAGDAFKGNLLVDYNNGKAAVEMMNAARYDAMAVGNHEFDQGYARLRENIRQARFPVLSANIFNAKSGKRIFRPSVVFALKSACVGVIGLTTPETPSAVSNNYTQGIRFEKDTALYDVINQEIARLRSKGCDLIIALGHMGSLKHAAGNRSEDIIRNTHGLDIFIDGHDHVEKNRFIDGVLLTETRAQNRTLGEIRWTGAAWEAKQLTGQELTATDAETEGVITRHFSLMQDMYRRVVGKSDVSLSGERYPGVRTQETEIGNFLTDAILWQSRQSNFFKNQIDVAILNGGCIRTGISKGEITLKTIKSLMPFNNTIEIIKVPGSVLLEALEAACASLPQATPAFAHVAGMNYTVKTAVSYAKAETYPNSIHHKPAQPGARVCINSIAGRPFDPKRLYTVASISSIFSGLDTYGAFVPYKPRAMNTKISDTQCIENYIWHLGGTIPARYASTENRIRILQ